MSNLSIFEEFPKLTFGELQHLNDDDVPLCVNHTEAIHICKYSLEAGEAVTSEIQKLWVDKLLKAYQYEKMREENWIEILSFLDEAYKHLVEANDVTLEVLNDLQNWLSDCFKFMQWVDSSLKEFNVACIFIVLGYALETVIGALNFYKKWNQENNLKSHLKSSLNIHNSTLKIINENLEKWTVDNSTEFSYLTEVLVSLCVIGEQQSSPVDFKIIVETWKTIAKISLHCGKYKNLEPTDDKMSSGKWAQRPTLYLSKEIRKNISIVYKKDTVKQPLEQIEKYLRVTNFYAKLLQKLCCDFKHNDFPIAEDFYETYFLSKSLPAHLEDNKISLLLDKYVNQALNQIFMIIFKNNFIIKGLTEAASKNTSWSSVMEDFIKASVFEKDSEFITKNSKFFVDSFKEIFKDNSILVGSSKYENFIELFAALELLSRDACISKSLKHFVLSSELNLAFISSDILLIISRYNSSFASFDECLKEFYFWRKCNQHFVPFTNNTRQLIIMRMLRYSYHLCKKHKDYKKDKLWNEYSDIQISSKNFRFFMSLPLNRCLGENALVYLKEKLIKGVFEMKTNLAKGSISFDDYYKMVIYLFILTSVEDIILPSDFVTDILEVVYKIFKRNPEQAEGFHLFIKHLLNFIVKHPKALEESSLITLMKHIANHNDIYFKVSSFLLMNFLQSFKKNKNYSSLGPIISQILTNAGPLKNLKTFKKLFDGRKVQWLKPLENIKLYKDIFSSRQKGLHRCTEIQASKRLRLSPRPESSEVQNILKSLMEKSNLLGSYAKDLDSNDFVRINNILEILKKILENQQKSK